MRKLLAILAAYWWPLTMFWSTIISLVAIAVTGRVTAAQAILGQAIAAGAWLVVLWLLVSARGWRRNAATWRSNYELCEQTRRYWMQAAQSNGALAMPEEPDP